MGEEEEEEVEEMVDVVYIYGGYLMVKTAREKLYHHF